MSLTTAIDLNGLHARIDAQRAALKSIAIREQFGRSMIALAEQRADMVALTADLMHATGMAAFGKRFPERLVNVGIAEQNMTGMAAGLGACGKLPVVCGYAAFTTLRAVEQAKVDCAYNEVKVILCGLSAGLSYGVGGPTHQTFEDVAIMRAIPGMRVVVPSDAVEVDAALHACAAAPAAAPIYLRLGRGPEWVFNEPGIPFELGRARRLREGADLCFIANGSMVVEALLASDALRSVGIHASVLNVHTVKPIDRGAIVIAAETSSALVVAEEHNIIGGLGSAVLEVLSGGTGCPVHLVGINDEYPPVGPTHALRAQLGLDAHHLAMRAIALQSR